MGEPKNDAKALDVVLKPRESAVGIAFLSYLVEPPRKSISHKHRYATHSLAHHFIRASAIHLGFVNPD